MTYRLLLFFYLVAFIEWACINKNEQKVDASKPSFPQINPSTPYIEIYDVLIGGSGSYYKGKRKHSNVANIKYDQTKNLAIDFSAKGFAKGDTLELSWKLDGYNDWSKNVKCESEFISYGEFFDFLKPGRYNFMVKIRKLHESWGEPKIYQIINVSKPIWWFWWFWASIIAGPSLIIYLIVKWRVRSARKHEREKAKHEKELLELEAKALRSQMNPHFIYNSMNSIKALIENDEEQASINYLTTFSKLIRTIFQNSDKREISLYDEIETCRLYTQLETMRLNGKLKYIFDIDPNVDLKSLMVPALIVQPFIENAIWHGIAPKEEGMIKVLVKGDKDTIICEVDDDGIGREKSKLHKPITPVIHESRGVYLSKARLDLEKSLNDNCASIDIIDKYENEKPTGTKVVIKFFLK
jgi:two-component sensor histidine kinase